MSRHLTIPLFVLLLGLTGVLAAYSYSNDQPCREWKARHPGGDPSQATMQENGDIKTVGAIIPANG